MRFQRRKRLRPLIPLASMGDIAFLLIIFFMLTSVFMKEGHIKVEPPTYPDIEVRKPGRIFVTMDEQGRLYLQGDQSSVAGLESAARDLLRDSDEKLVMLKIDRSVPQRQFGPVLMALSKAGGEIALVGRKAGKRR